MFLRYKNDLIIYITINFYFLKKLWCCAMQWESGNFCLQGKRVDKGGITTVEDFESQR